jgi:hypothetical protein
MFEFFKRFKESEDGAVTVDWVVLTAAVVGLGGAAVVGLQSANGTVTDRTSEYLERQEPQSNPDIQDIYNPS